LNASLDPAKKGKEATVEGAGCPVNSYEDFHPEAPQRGLGGTEKGRAASAFRRIKRGKKDRKCRHYAVARI